MKISLPLGIVITLRRLYLAILVVAVGSLSATYAVADTIAVDEQGHIAIGGSLQPMGVLAPDPNTGYQVLVYSLPFAGNPGEVILIDPNSSVSDYIRFPGNGTLEYFSEVKQETTLSAAAAFENTNIKVGKTSGYKVGEQFIIDTGALAQEETIVAVGTSGAAGTGITIATPLQSAHMSGSAITEPLELADTFPFDSGFDPFFGLNDATVTLNELAGGTVWSPGTSGIGGDPTLPEYDFGATITPVPAPGSLPLFAGGLAALGLLDCRRKRKALSAA